MNILESLIYFFSINIKEISATIFLMLSLKLFQIIYRMWKPNSKLKAIIKTIIYCLIQLLITFISLILLFAEGVVLSITFMIYDVIFKKMYIPINKNEVIK